MAVTADRVVVELQAKLDQYKRQLADGERKFDKHMGNMRRQAGLTEKSTVRSFNTIGAASRSMASSLRTSALALASVAGATAGVRVLADFAQAMSTVAAVTQATETQFASLEKKARELGASTRFSATQAAEGMLYLARAGFDTDQVLGSIEGTLQLAQAGNLDLGRAADIASNVLQGFRLEVAETARVVDVMALAANSSNTDVVQLGEAMKYAGPIAAGLGVGIEDTAAAVSALSDAGLQGSMAGTGLRRVMIGLEKQSKQGEQVLAKYGLTMKDVSISATGSLANSLDLLADKGVNTADAIALFGLRGGPAFEVLQSSIPKVRELADAYDEAGGTAERIADVMDKNLNGALLATKSRLEELILALGDAGAEDGLVIALEGLQALLTVTAENADILGVALVALAVRAVLPLAAAALGKALPAIASLRTALGLLTVQGGAALVTTQALSGSMALLASSGPAIAIGAAAAAFIVLSRNAREGREAIERAGKAIDDINTFLADTEEFDGFVNLKTGAENTIPVFNDMRDAALEIVDALQKVSATTIATQIQQGSAAVAKAQAALDDLEKKQAQSRLNKSEGFEGRRILERGGSITDIETEFDAQIIAARQSLARAKIQLKGVVEGAFGEGGVDIGAAIAEGGIDGLVRALNQRSTDLKNVGAIEQERKNIEELYASLDRAKEAGADAAVKRFEEQIAIAEATIDFLKDGFKEVDARALARETVRDNGDSGGGSTDKERKAAESVLADLEKAILDTYDAERKAAEDLYNDRIKAIETLGLKGQEAANQQLAAEIALNDERKRIDAEEQKAKDDKAAREAALVDKEEELLRRVLDARDRAAGRSIEIALRDFDARKTLLERSFDDSVEGERRKNAALAALEEERQTFLDEARTATSGFETDNPVDARIKQIEAARDKELALEQEKLETLIGYQEEYNARKLEIETAAEEQIAAVRRAALAGQLGQAAEVFSGLSGLAKAYAGEQSGIYKTLFGVEQAFRAGQALLAAPAAAAKALAEVPYPLNLAASALVYAQAIAQVAKIGSVQPGFARGVVNLQGPGSSTSDSIDARLSKGESVVTAEGTRLNAPLIKLMNRGIDVRAQLERISQPAAINPAFITGGGRSINIGGFTLEVLGNVTEDTLPSLRAEMDRAINDLKSSFSGVIDKNETHTTPRHERNRFFKG